MSLLARRRSVLSSGPAPDAEPEPDPSPDAPDTAGLAVWYDADAITGLADTDDVVQWDDLSGNGLHLTAPSAAERPTYRTGILNGLPVVRFDGAEVLRNVSSTDLAQPNTILAVAASTNTSGEFGNFVDGSDSSKRNIVGAAPDDTWRIWSGVSPGNRLSDEIRDTLPHLFTARFYTDLSQLRIDGDVEINDNTGSHVLQLIVLGASSALTSQHLKGDIAEVRVFDRALSVAERLEEEEYLAAKWGLAVNHPAATAFDTEVDADSPAWWLKLEETSGATAADAVSTNDATVVGADLDVDSFANTQGAVNLDGTDDYLWVPDTSTLEMTNAGEYTLLMLAKLDDPDDDRLDVLFDKTGTSTNNNNQYWLRYDNRSSQGSPRRLGFGVAGLSTCEVTGDKARNLMALGAIIHAVKRTDRTEMWVNGVLEDTVTGTGFSLASNSLDVGVGAMASGPAFFAKGRFGPTVFFHSALSQARIEAHAQAAGF